MTAKPDMPEFSYGYLGEQPRFKEFGLTAVTHKEPKLYLDGNVIEMEMRYENPVKTLVVLKSQKDDEEKENCVFTQTRESDHIIQILVTVPDKGFWKLEIYALPASESGNTLTGVFNYAIHCPNVEKKAYPYPKRYKQWSDGCYLYEPLLLHKNITASSVHFKVLIPAANDVAVCVNKEQPWTHLKKEGGGIWAGDVSLADHYGRNVSVTVNARLGDDKGGSYAILLEYTGI